MLVTEKTICKHCNKEFELTYVAPKAPFLIPFCEKCEEELNSACGGSWVSAVYGAIKDANPFERG